MRIYVCVKHVPDTAANIRPLGATAFDESVKFIINPFDEYALEQALLLREEQRDAEVIAVTLGRETAAATLRFALAMGADRGILVKREGCLAGSIETARLLFEAIQRDGSPDLIFTGKQSVDAEGMQLPYRLGSLFDFPVVVGAVAFSMRGGRITVEREGEGESREVIETGIPAIIGATRGLNRPRCPTLPDMMRAKKKEILVLEDADLGAGGDADPVELVGLQTVPDRRGGEILTGPPEAMVRKLLYLLREEARVL